MISSKTPTETTTVEVGAVSEAAPVAIPHSTLPPIVTNVSSTHSVSSVTSHGSDTASSDAVPTEGTSSPKSDTNPYITVAK